MRLGGNIGEINVTWIVLSDPEDDLVVDKGQITFQAGQTEAYIPMQIRGDSEPEMDELFLIQLTGVKGGVRRQTVLFHKQYF